MDRGAWFRKELDMPEGARTHTHTRTRTRTHTHVNFEQEKFQLVLYRVLYPTLQVTFHPGMFAFSVAPCLPGVPWTVSRMKCPQGE